MGQIRGKKGGNKMDFQERIQDIQTEINSIKKMLGETNDELSKLHGEIINSQEVSDEEFREAWEFWRCTDDSEILIDVYGYSTVADISDNMSLSEFVNKYKEYKKKKEIEDKEIRIGDKVVESFDKSVKGVVTMARYIRDYLMYIVWRDGSAGMVKK